MLRAHLNRNTVHLVTAEDYLDFRPLFARLHEGGLRANFGRSLAGADLAEIRSRARSLLGGSPLTRAKLGKLLASSWPQADPVSLAYAACALLPVIQIPPRGIWGETGQATFTLADDWLGSPVTCEPSSGAVGRLRTFRGEDGAELLDLPDAPRPDPGTPAPVRFLPEYDNLLLSHADRSRVIPHSRAVPLPPGNGSAQGTLLIDGMWNATWKIGKDGGLDIRPFIPLSPATRDEIAAEGVSLLAFAGATRAAAAVRFGAPG